MTEQELDAQIKEDDNLFQLYGKQTLYWSKRSLFASLMAVLFIAGGFALSTAKVRYWFLATVAGYGFLGLSATYLIVSGIKNRAYNKHYKNLMYSYSKKRDLLEKN